MPDLTSLSNVPSDTKPPLIKGEWGGVGVRETVLPLKVQCGGGWEEGFI
jgi:hypothetical protein